MKSIYSSFTKSKNGLTVPLYKNGHAAHSRYNPEREAETAVAELPKSNFYVLIGFGAGYTATALLKKNEKAKIFAIEKTDSDINFLLSDAQISQTACDRRITLLSIDKISCALPELYLPSVYGDLQISVLRSWAQENEDAAKSAKEQVENAIRLISADYSVQAYFGKNWQRNILCNLRNNCQKRADDDDTKYSDLNISVPTEKTAFVAGAGPSLEKTSELLKKNRDKYFVIATDTAYGILTRNGIFCDMAVCIDSQNISHAHFLLEKNYGAVENCEKNYDVKNCGVSQEEKAFGTIFVLDIASAPCVIRSARKKVLVTTGHPLVSYAEQTQFSKSRNHNNENHGTGKTASSLFPKLFSGAGTVTIAATDLARSLGFKNIIVAGADFSYLNGKSYSRGSYLDTLYHSVSSRINTAETQFDALMFRAPLFHSGNRAVSKVLEMYQKSFKEWALKSGFQISQKDDLWHLTLNKANKDVFFHNDMPKFDFSRFLETLKSDIENEKFLAENPLSPLQIAALPYIAQIRRKNLNFLQNSDEKNADKLSIDLDLKTTDDFDNFLKIAYKSIVRYAGGEK